MFFIVLSEACA